MIDGLQHQHKPLLSEENGCCIDSSVKMLLLRSLHKTGLIGGVATSANEEWQYSVEGAMNCLVGERHIQYTWTGEFLQPSLGAGSVNLGTGKWDGVNLYWFPRSQDQASIKNIMGDFFYGAHPFCHFLYNPSGNEYLSEDAKQEWQWTRHFLASKDGESEWIIEGQVPRPVVMLLQMMRYYLSSPQFQLDGLPIVGAKNEGSNTAPVSLVRTNSARNSSFASKEMKKRLSRHKSFNESPHHLLSKGVQAPDSSLPDVQNGEVQTEKDPE